MPDQASAHQRGELVHFPVLRDTEQLRFPGVATASMIMGIRVLAVLVPFPLRLNKGAAG